MYIQGKELSIHGQEHPLDARRHLQGCLQEGKPCFTGRDSMYRPFPWITNQGVLVSYLGTFKPQFSFRHFMVGRKA